MSNPTDAAKPESLLVALAVALGARSVPGWSANEERLASSLPQVDRVDVERVRHEIQQGQDPLGDRFATLRSAVERRPMGAIYTPLGIVDYMVAWAQANGQPVRIVDPGAGSSRFLLRSASRFPGAELVAVEIDPLAALLSRGNLAAAGLAERSHVVLGDYREVTLPKADGPTLYVGNPPYVRHHQIQPEWKAWLSREASKKGYRASQLAGLHAYFFLATALRAARDDYGIFITAAEWLDVNYGRLIRDLFLDRLGGQSVLVVEPAAEPFPDAATTAAITTFRIEAKPKKIRFRRIAALSELANPDQGRNVRRERLEAEPRWSHLSRGEGGMPEDHVELGELFRVHRGQVTGANKIWIEGKHSRDLPLSVLFPSVTRARELLQAGLVLEDPTTLRRVIDIPADLEALSPEDRRRVERFLRLAKGAGADLGYIARTRKAWWSVGLKQPAPILATYMARRPPAFVRNLAEARHINIAHGLYPREEFPAAVLEGVVKYLSGNISVAAGRTYAGGLTKFEPREMERLPVPLPEVLAGLSAE
ncbi:MAG TPA: class I SAM-dependent methyltransferase [Thermoanaerobaculia bacterium]|nr:class I SAM-dependent methyltransferase [Thermoanaerobaculia bacterium]